MEGLKTPLFFIPFMLNRTKTVGFSMSQLLGSLVRKDSASQNGQINAVDTVLGKRRGIAESRLVHQRFGASCWDGFGRLEVSSSPMRL